MSDGRRALVVDDMPVNRLLAAKLLARGGWTVTEAEDGPSALDRLRNGDKPDLILLDISMPVMSGQELCRIIRDSGLAGPAVKIIAYTAHAMPEDAATFQEDGFDAVLIKPIGRASLGAALAEVGLILGTTP